MIPYGHQNISEDDIRAVVEVLRSDWLTQGPAIERFEAAVADYCGVAHAVAVCNGTAALHVATLALDLGPGGLLWTSPNTFVASANCARYVGADVDFVDIDAETLCMSPQALELKLIEAERTGRLPDVVVPVHFGGLSCDMQAIGALSQRFGFTVLEDCSHAIGGRHLDSPIGSCRYSAMSTLSFHPVKIVTSGEGGMVLTNDDGLAERLRLFRTHGITKDSAWIRRAPEGDWYYEQIELGYNYRITDIQAALGASQMQRVDGFVQRRNELAARYRDAFADLPLGMQAVDVGSTSAYHLFVLRVLPEAGVSRRAVFDSMRRDDIGVNVHYIPVHLQPYYRELGFAEGDFPEAERYYEEAVTIPLYPSMTSEQQDCVIRAVRSALTDTTEAS